MPTKNVEQKVEIEKEVIDLKSLKKVSSNVDVIIDSIENFSNNITKRNERKNGKKEGWNCIPCVLIAIVLVNQMVRLAAVCALKKQNVII